MCRLMANEEPAKKTDEREPTETERNEEVEQVRFLSWDRALVPE